MCGIAGGVRLGSGSDSAFDLPSAVATMSALIQHRGPDDQGSWLSSDGRVCLAQRRLAIVDLSPRGHQPMAASDGRAWITLNGEIYNFRPLRGQLAAAGYRFSSDSDTEVVLAAYRTWGLPRTLQAFDGMFAFALWDEDSRTLHLARDRAGEKPLFIGVIAGGLFFASELKAFASLSSARLTPNRRAVSGYLAYGYVPGPESMFNEVFQLPPGTCLSLGPDVLFTQHGSDVARPDDLVRRVVRYWSSNDVATEAERRSSTTSGPESPDALGGIDALLREVVANQLACDVPVGVFLSGGIDSSLVAAVAQRVATQPVGAYTVAFGDQGFDESQHAAAVAAHLGMRHEILRLAPHEITDAVPRLAAGLDEPTANASYFPVALMSRLARQRVTVVLSGDGGDEAFCGYNRYRQLDRLARLARTVPRGVLRAGVQSAATIAKSRLLSRGVRLRSMPQVLLAEALARASRFLAARDFDRGYDATMRLFDDPDLVAAGVDPIGVRERTSDLHDDLLVMMSTDFLSYLPDDNLAKVDRAAMSTALEVRLPLLNHRILAASWGLGRRGWLHDGTSKWALRQLLARYVPSALFDRPKMGFSVSVRDWLTGPLREWASDTLRSRTLVDWLGLRPAFVESEWRSMLAGSGSNARRVWALAMLGSWGDAYAGGRHAG
jgi:asparagine synthase (glutamine-hydrolysing)